MSLTRPPLIMRYVRPLVAALFSVLLPVANAATDALADGFRSPPADARPQTWWHWMNGNISKEGITADLEAMHRIGVGGAQIFNVSQGEPPGPVTVYSPEWFELVKHAVAEANRLGIELTMHNCPGWSESGGPWVTPAQAMQRVVWSEMRVRGPQALATALPAPDFVVANTCTDIAVFAFPAAPAETVPLSALQLKITASAAGVDAGPLLNHEAGAAVKFPLPTPKAPQSVTIEFAPAPRFGSLRLLGRDATSMPTAGRIEASEDGRTFRKVADLPALARGRNHGSMLATFPETSARFVRVVMTRTEARAKAIVLGGIEFGGTRLAHTEERAGYRPDANLAFLGDAVPAADTIARGRLVDLSGFVKDGRLEWQVPEGAWTIVRFCHTPTGQTNAPAPDAGRGLEADKMNPAAVQAHFAASMGRVITAVGPLAGKSLKGVLTDSWEAGCENWTPAFRAEFQRRRGYDPLPWLPVLTGRPVSSVEESERFLWDFRRTIGDLIAENHYAVFQRLSAQHGMKFVSEAPGIGMPTIADELECKGRTDVPMGEFWMDGHNDSKEAASAAHVYGKRLAAAESFTARTADAKWMKAPFDHKMLGDLHFTLGINQYVFHRYAHQPWLDRVPGMTMGPWGTNFERTNTWWEQARAWMEYVTRCQYLLQRGSPVADVCYFYGENVPNTLAKREPTLPAGHDYDVCNAEVLLTRLSVRDGRLVLPDGVSYSVLLLADSDRMTPAVLRKLRALVSDGATVVGRRPVRSPSLSGYPQCDDEVRGLAQEIWGDCDGKTVTEHRLGKGRVVWGQPIEAVLPAPDFVADGTGKFAMIHRRMDGAEVYFVSSQNTTPVSAALSFRVTGRVPELWRAEAGTMVRAGQFTERDGRTVVPVDFEPAGSVFVLFRAPSAEVDPVVRVTRDGADVKEGATVAFGVDNQLLLATAIAGQYALTTRSGRERSCMVPALPAALEVSGPWTLSFPAGWGAPAETSVAKLESWTRSTNDGTKYFSGTASYRTGIDVPPEMLGRGRRVWLDLGVVKEVAEVKVNGRDLGVLWKPPFRAELTSVIRPGRNDIEVRVTNLWPNRLIGDLRRPEAQRRTWTTFNPFTAESPLLDSGLLGPVRITAAAEVSVGP